LADQTWIIAALVEHKPGVLYKVSNMFRRRNFNIESISVGPTEQEMARMTITVIGDESTVEQLVKQMTKLIDIIKVSTLEPGNSVIRELALIKVHIPSTTARSDVIQYANIFRGRVLDVSPESLIIEVTGTSDKIDAFTELMKSFGVMELARTGITALIRGPKMIKVK